MIRRKMREVLGPIALSGLFAALLLAAVPASAAATAGPATQCYGRVSKGTETASGDPNTINYEFFCDWGVTAYTIVANRQRSDYSTIDDFDSDGLAYNPSGNSVPGIGFDCAGLLPGNGVNCNLSSGYLPAPDSAEGWIALTDPYCAYIPAGSPAGTKAQPAAVVQLIITDTNGNESGPFRLNLQPACGPTPKPKVKKKHHKQKKHQGKQHQGK